MEPILVPDFVPLGVRASGNLRFDSCGLGKEEKKVAEKVKKEG